MPGCSGILFISGCRIFFFLAVSASIRDSAALSYISDWA